VQSCVRQCPGQDSGSQGGIAAEWHLCLAGGQGRAGGPCDSAASPQQSDAVLLPLLLALDAKCMPVCKQGLAFDGAGKNPGLGNTENKVILEEQSESCPRMKVMAITMGAMRKSFLQGHFCHNTTALQAKGTA